MFIDSTAQLIEALKRNDGSILTLGPGDYELDLHVLGKSALDSLTLQGSGVPYTRLHLSEFVSLAWASQLRDLSIEGDALFDLTRAPYTRFDNVTFNSSAAGQSHVGKDWSTVRTKGNAIRIGDDPHGRGQDNTYRIQFVDCTFNFFERPFDLRSQQWINAFTLDGVVVNSAQIGLYAEAISLRTRACNFQCCESGMVLGACNSEIETHFERNKVDLVLADYSYANVFSTDARTIENHTLFVPPGVAGNKFKTFHHVSMGKNNAERHAAAVTLP